MSLISKIADLFRMGVKWLYSPDEVECPAGTKPAVKAAFWTAATKLEAAGIVFGHRHKIQRIVGRTDVVPRPGGWAFPVSKAVSPTGYAGGTTGSRRIDMALSPNGSINQHDMAHEWGHALLHGAGIVGTTQFEHELLGRAGL